ncbi:MAG TPA: hypoxanthine phosphoribosyltransferase [Firmicutes bacterium]|jgi:hypoxanthine phosphoribosyltransferase|nr:hypoxanthine phosphoribosyltransferase [Bacillota bacterium]
MGLDKKLEIGEMLLTEVTIQNRVRELAWQISHDYEGKRLLVVAVLKGAFIFVADLARHLQVPAAFDFLAVCSYGSATASSGEVRILKDLDESVEGWDVLLVEDIVDTGLTLNYLTQSLWARRPASLRICSLLDKPARRQVPVKLDYCGFQIPDKFAVGYGLDFDGRYRNAPFIFVPAECLTEGEKGCD